jgi:hypothetical protein
MIAEVKVHESLTSRIRPGQRATVVVDAVGREAFEAEVESIGVMAESGGWLDPNLREYTVRLRLLHVNGSDLKPSMRCEAQILVDEVAQAQAVPIQAVFSDRGQTFCYVYDDGYFTRQPVATGRASETWIEIKDGLSEGDAVILREPKPSEIRREEKSDSAPGRGARAARRTKRSRPRSSRTGRRRLSRHSDRPACVDACLRLRVLFLTPRLRISLALIALTAEQPAGLLRRPARLEDGGRRAGRGPDPDRAGLDAFEG